VNKCRENKPSELLIAVAAQVTIEEESENEKAADWKQPIRIRLMELDVDPGHDFEHESGKSAGNQQFRHTIARNIYFWENQPGY
jgi:hypothetical protein